MRDRDLGRALLAIARDAIGAELGLAGQNGGTAPRARRARRHLRDAAPGRRASRVHRIARGAPRARRRRPRERRRRRVPRSALSAARRRTSSAGPRSRFRSSPPTSRSSSTTRSTCSRQLRPGVDGVVLQYGQQRATFLPQVWESLPEPRAFVAALKHKAGLAGGRGFHAVPASRAIRSTSGRKASSRRRRFAHEPSRPLVAPPRRRPHPVRPLPARLPPARGPARRVLRPPARGRRDRAHDLRPLVGLLHRSDREEAAEPLLPGFVGALVRHRGLQSRVQVLPELGHLEVARDGHADGRGVAASRLPRRRSAPARRASPSRTTTP